MDAKLKDSLQAEIRLRMMHSLAKFFCDSEHDPLQALNAIEQENYSLLRDYAGTLSLASKLENGTLTHADIIVHGRKRNES